jgi:cytochrome P450
MAQNFPHDAIAAVSHPDPYQYYATLVAERPLYYDEPLTSWVASSAEAVTAVLSSNLCGVRPAAEPIPTSLIGSGAGEVFRQFIRMNDRDDRLHIKRALAVAIDSIDAARVSDITERYAGLLLQPGDLPSTFAFQLPIYVIADLLGDPGDDLPWVSGLIDDFVRCLAPGSGAKAIEQGKTAADRLSSYFRSPVADRVVQDSNTLMAVVSRELSHADCDRVDAAVANAIGFLFQAYDASAGLIGNGLIALSLRRDLCDQVALDSGMLRPFIDEVVRFDSPVQNTRRYVHRSGKIAGHTVHAGDAILVLLAAANRDPRANVRAEIFDIYREDRRVFTFGLGAHACPGESLAITIAIGGIACVLRSVVDLASLARSVRYRPSPNVRIPEFA